MLKLENSIRGLSFSRVAFDLTIQVSKKDATQDTQLQELRAEIAALKASMTK